MYARMHCKVGTLRRRHVRFPPKNAAWRACVDRTHEGEWAGNLNGHVRPILHCATLCYCTVLYCTVLQCGRSPSPACGACGGGYRQGGWSGSLVVADDNERQLKEAANLRHDKIRCASNRPPCRYKGGAV